VILQGQEDKGYANNILNRNNKLNLTPRLHTAVEMPDRAFLLLVAVV
jgi:hypothetical protein